MGERAAPPGDVLYIAPYSRRLVVSCVMDRQVTDGFAPYTDSRTFHHAECRQCIGNNKCLDSRAGLAQVATAHVPRVDAYLELRVVVSQTA